MARLYDKSHNLIESRDGRRRALLLLGGVMTAIFVITLLIVFIGGQQREVQLTDGSVLTVVRVTVGTNHVAYSEPWHRIIRAIPFLPERIYYTAEPFRWRSSSPSVVVWCSWRGFTPASPPPEFILLDEEGTELLQMKKGEALRSYADMGSVGERRGIFGVSTSVPPTNVIRLRIFQRDETQSRSQVVDLEFKNPAQIE